MAIGVGWYGLLAIVTEIPRFYYNAVRELKGRGIQFLTFGLEDEIPSYITVVLTSREERKHVRSSIVVAHDDLPTAVSECVRALNGLKKDYKRLVIGIDPGASLGVAVLADNKVIEARNILSPEGVPPVLRGLLETYSGAETVIRVGDGGGIYCMRVLKLLQENFDAKIEVVDETSTTPALGREAPAGLRDVIAAINIALKEGSVLEKAIELAPTPGEIKNLQRESRNLSRNITISKGLAELVAKGELTLEEAIEAHRNSHL
ncbi:MAG: hypothetical protein AABX40_03070 [Candidatus Hydrothermarchaeota archaeon]